MNPDRLRQLLTTGATLLGVTFLSTGCIFVHLRGEEAERALRQIHEERYYDHHHEDGDCDECDDDRGIAAETVSPFGARNTMTVDLDVPADQLEATFETLCEGVVGRLENRGAEVIRYEEKGTLESVYTYEQHGVAQRIHIALEATGATTGTPYRFVATWQPED